MVVLVIFYGSIVFFLVAIVAQLIRFSKTPVHLRWEIYRENYSYTPSGRELPQYGLYHKLKAVALDMLLLRGYYQTQRVFWIFLYAFHLGVYTLVLWHIYLFAVSLLEGNTNGEWLLLWGHSATGLASTGAIGIYILRIRNKEMKIYYPTIYYYRWILIFASLVVGFLAVFTQFGNNMNAVIAYVDRQLDFDWAYKLNSPIMPSLHVLFASLWLIYLPFSHVMKLLFKYYHELRWDFVPNSGGGRLARAMAKNLSRPVSWSAAHINSGRSWAMLADNAEEKGDNQ